MHRVLWWWLASCLAVPIGVAAETVYVTDRLQTGIRVEREGAITRQVEAGTALEVLERSERALRVRDKDGKEGWIDQRFVSPEAPARVQLVKVQGELAKARAELASARAQPVSAGNYEFDPLWLLLGGVAVLLVGFIVGILWHRESLRRRMGGMHLRI